ncbi:carbohydrate-binding domain-containing protein [Azospirillum sp. sgz302134]
MATTSSSLTDVQFTVNAWGQAAGNVWPRFTLRVDGVDVGQAYATNTSSTGYNFTAKLAADQAHKVQIVYDNDGWSNGQDRNLFVKSLVINGTTVASTASNVTYDKGALDGKDVVSGQEGMYWNGALNFDLASTYFPKSGGSLATGGSLITGTTGNDLLKGTAGNDTIDGLGGIDTLDLSTATAGVKADLAAGKAQYSSTHVDTLLNIENIQGSAYNDQLYGNAGANKLNGGAGNNLLDGGAGADTLIGGAGADTLIGGDGNDVLTTGSGADVIVVNKPGAGVDRLTDFSVSNDKIDLTPMVQALQASGVKLASDYVKFVANGTGSNIVVDVDGASGSGAGQTVMTVENIGTSNLKLGINVIAPTITATAPPPAPTPTPTPTTDTGYVRPFGPNAPWNVKIDGIAHDPNSANLSDMLWNHASDRPGNFNLNFGETYAVYSSKEASGWYTVDTTWNTNIDNTKIPWNPAWQIPGEGSDRKVIVLDPDTGHEWDLWQTSFDGSTVHATNGSLVPGNYFTYEGGNPSSRGIGIEYLAMLVRPEEIKAGKIEHALAMSIDNTDGDRYVAPATKLEHPDNPAGIPEGTRFALNISDADIAAWEKTLPADQQYAAHVIAVALRDYGWFITDTGGSGAIEMEASASAAAEWNALGMSSRLVNGHEMPRDMLDGLITHDNIYALVPSDHY